MIKFYRFETGVRTMPKRRGLPSGVTINDAITHAIEALPAEQNGVVFKVTGTAGGDVNFAVAMKVHKDWIVDLGVNFPKGHAAEYRIDLVIPF